MDPRTDGKAARFPWPRSDLGTILIHWGIVGAMGASLATGLRVSSDSRDAVVSRFLEPILPQGQIWGVHLGSGAAVFFLMTAYAGYMALSGLHRRNSPRRMSAGGGRKGLARTANVALHWLLYALVAVLAATGVALYAGHGGWVVAVHAACAIACLFYVPVHVGMHYLQGAWGQMFRLFRPARVDGATGRQGRPLLLACAAAAPVVVGLSLLDVGSRDVLHVRKVAAAPDLARLQADPAWANANEVSIRTMQGANFGGSGESLVRVRAVRDDERVYFLFRWDDPSRSLRRVPLEKRADGWHLMDVHAPQQDVTEYYEDKLAVIWSEGDGFGSDGATHMGPHPLPGKPGPFNGRGFHYTDDGHMIDMWQWKAARGGMLGMMENMHIGQATVPTPAERAGKARYQAGYTGDPGKGPYRYNFAFSGPESVSGVVTPALLPSDVAATSAAMGRVDRDPDASVEEGSRWWMMEGTETVAYSPEADAAIPVGTVIPGVLMKGAYEGQRAGIDAQARWADGQWTLAASRKLATGSTYDIDFIAGRKLHMWVAAFDHTQTRHTRHMRPVTVTLD